MTKVAEPQIDAETLMRRLGRELVGSGRSANATRETVAPAATRSHSIQRACLPRIPEPEAGAPYKAEYTLGDFLALQDEAFIQGAYAGILRRDPDAQGRASFLGALRAARLTKTEIVGRLRYSSEGRAAAVPIRGLVVPFALCTARRIPIFGHFVAILQHLLNLPELVRSQYRLEARLAQQDAQSRSHINALRDAVQSAFDAERLQVEAWQSDTTTAQARVEEEIQTGIAMLQARLSTKADHEQFTWLVNGLLEALGRKADLEQLAEIRRELGDAYVGLGELVSAKADQAQLGELTRTIERVTNQINAELARLAASKADRSEWARWIQVLEGTERAKDEVYAELEDRFRGSPDEISSRMGIYVPLLQETARLHPGGYLLDVGCGRGEWLTLVERAGLQGIGIDVNSVAIARCQSAGLTVVQQEALVYLGGQQDGTVAAVTAFHVIEHVPFEYLLALVREAHRILEPGGLLLLETPNPENFSVSALHFYADPTHRNPIPPETLRFIVAQHGFVDIDVMRLNPFAKEEQLGEGHPAITGWINARFYGPRDYAVIARKPRATPVVSE